MEQPSHIFDGRNLLDEEKMYKSKFSYHRIGKPFNSWTYNKNKWSVLFDFYMNHFFIFVYYFKSSKIRLNYDFFFIFNQKSTKWST